MHDKPTKVSSISLLLKILDQGMNMDITNTLITKQGIKNFIFVLSDKLKNFLIFSIMIIFIFPPVI
jgi:hypothetical protein